MLFAIGAGSQVVAVDEFSNYPPEAPTTDLSGYTPNPEAIAAYDPDLVVISAYAEELVPQLTSLGIPVHVAPDTAVTLDDVYQQIEELGALTGHRSEAEALVAEMSAEIEELVAQVAGPRGAADLLLRAGRPALHRHLGIVRRHAVQHGRACRASRTSTMSTAPATRSCRSRSCCSPTRRDLPGGYEVLRAVGRDREGPGRLGRTHRGPAGSDRRAG